MIKKIKNLIKLIKLFLFHNFRLRQKILKNTFWLSLSRIIGGIFRAILVIFASRTLGSENYGYFTLALSFVLIFSFLPDFGLTAILTREFVRSSEDKEKRKKYFVNGLVTFLILSFIALVSIVILKDIFIRHLAAKRLIIILGIMMIIDSLREFLYSFFRAEEKMEKQTLSYSLTNIFILIFSFYFVFLNQSPYSFAWGYLIGAVAGLIFTLFQIPWQTLLIKSLHYYVDKNTILSLLKLSWPIGLSNFLFFVLTYLDTLILGWFKSASDVGVYQVSVKIYEFFLFLPLSLALSTFPSFSREIFLSELKKKLKIALELAFWFALPLTFLLVPLSSKIINILFGPEYLLASLSFTILSFNFIFQFPAMILINYAVSLDKRKDLLLFDILAIVFNFLTNLIIIPKLSFIGAAITTVISSILFLLLITIYLIKNNFIDNEIKFNFKVLIASVLLFGFIKIFSLNIFLQIILGLFIYITVLLLLKEELTLDLVRFIKDNL